MNPKFSEPKSISFGGMKKITVKTAERNPLYVYTEKCHSFGVKKDDRFKTTSMSNVLDETSVKKFEDIIDRCEKELGKSLSSKVLYRRDDGTVTVYPKFKKHTKIYENGEEIDPAKYARGYQGRQLLKNMITSIRILMIIGGKTLNGGGKPERT